jgi:hypothetical protein
MKENFMKKLIKLFGIIAIVAVIGFSMFACGGDDGGGNGNGNGSETSIGITGSFSYEGSNAKFYANQVSNTPKAVLRTVSGLSSNDKELEGKIEDGDIIFNLKGVYNTADNKFYLSAGSSFLIYQIAGAYSSGKIAETKATIKIKEGDEWTVHTVSATSSSDVSISGSASAGQENGVPTSWFGIWENPSYWDLVNNHGALFTITAYQFIDHSLPEQTTGFLKVVSLGGGKLEIIWEGKYYEHDDTHMWLETKYRNIWLEENAQGGLTLTEFSSSYFDTYAEAEAFDTSTAGSEEKHTQNFRRYNGGAGGGAGG